MGKKELQSRDNWQNESGLQAINAENRFFHVFQEYFLKNSEKHLQIISKPNELNNIYKDIQLPQKILSKIYNPPNGYGRHGISPDYAIKNLISNKTLYIEVKRQDGWIEGKEMSAGRGNAHERACKLFTPGLLNIMKKIGGLDNIPLPFWIIFQGDIARDPKRTREIYCWFSGFENHFYLWSNEDSDEVIIKHFQKYFESHLA
ncbi:restriction endonuclease [Helicobacter didelphidarum]|uniref:Restriction endonuclease n=1 Tax=Helicobacter didelphidarum TaxID=2040648 RepID=A0A3D8IHZ6_9HELI|nr:MunI family type II restriction endonuclease [Helicobacter didelphidarum]RDU64957.1 restriction endonuclease [Helicobacter didelphidarum]